MKKPPKGWTAGAVRIAVRDVSTKGKRFKMVAGFGSAGAPGLVVTPEQGAPDGWTVTHRASGYVIDYGGSLRAACRLAERLADIADWTRSRTALMRDPGLVSKLRNARKAQLGAA